MLIGENIVWNGVLKLFSIIVKIYVIVPCDTNQFAIFQMYINFHLSRGMRFVVRVPFLSKSTISFGHTLAFFLALINILHVKETACT